MRWKLVPKGFFIIPTTTIAFSTLRVTMHWGKVVRKEGRGRILGQMAKDIDGNMGPFGAYTCVDMGC